MLSYFAIGRSLKFSLGGDDWLALYRYITTFHTFLDHFNISKYMGNYDAANILMGLIYRLFEFNPFPYYLISFIFRVLASLSFYLPIFALTKNRIASILPILFFSVSYIGIETTNWVFNMTTYISLALFNIFLYLYIKNKLTLRSTLVQTSILFLSFFFTPNRMHALVIMVPLLELIRLKYTNSKNYRLLILRVGLFLVPILIFRRLTASEWDQTYFRLASNFLSEPYNYLYYFLANVGTALIPDRFLYLVFGSFSNANSIKTITGVVFLSIFPLFFFIMRRKYPTISMGGILAISFSILFLIAPWLVFSSGGPFLSDSRYLTIPGAFLMVSVSLFIGICWQEKKSIYYSLASSIIILFITLNLFSLNNYFDLYLSHGRDAKVSSGIFNQLLPLVKFNDNNAPLVFLFTADDYSMLYNAVTFGFEYRFSLIHLEFAKRIPLKFRPFPVDSQQSLLDILKNPQSGELKRYGYPNIKIPLENVYSFILTNKQLIPNTKQLRQEVSILLER